MVDEQQEDSDGRNILVGRQKMGLGGKGSVHEGPREDFAFLLVIGSH